MYKDQRESSYQPFEIVNIHTNSENSESLCNLFVKEFFYNELVYNQSIRNQGITINEGANDFVYELSDFSKKHPNEEFTLEFINKRNKKTQKIFKIKEGSAKLSFTYDKNKSKTTKKPIIQKKGATKNTPKIDKEIKNGTD